MNLAQECSVIIPYEIVCKIFYEYNGLKNKHACIINEYTRKHFCGDYCFICLKLGIGYSIPSNNYFKIYRYSWDSNIGLYQENLLIDIEKTKVPSHNNKKRHLLYSFDAKNKVKICNNCI